MPDRAVATGGPGLDQQLATLAEFGATPEGGVSRIAYSAADRRARDWLDAELAGLGMSVRRDRAGNSIAVLAGENPELRPIAIGSHTDTVPNGGRFDGSLGLTAALHCVRELRRAGSRLRHPLAVINFAAEEATMAGATFGSRAFVGALDSATIEREAFDGVPVRRHLEGAGLDPEALTEGPHERLDLAAFLELHIEQGPILDLAGVPIGIVEGIVGIRRYAVGFSGTANHAGTTPMSDRDDALVAAAPFVGAVRDAATANGVVGTVGSLKIDPGSPNVIPGEVRLDLELRGTADSLLNATEDDLREAVLEAGGTVDRLSAKPPQRFRANIRASIEAACEAAAVDHQTLWSGAGHDAGVLATAGEAAMIFVPSKGGISHSPAEFTDSVDCLTGANVLLESVITLDSELDRAQG